MSDAVNGKVKATMTTVNGETSVRVSYSCTDNQHKYLIFTLIEKLAENRDMSVMDTLLSISEEMHERG